MNTKPPSVASIKILASPKSVTIPEELGNIGRIEVIILNEDPEISLELQSVEIGSIEPDDPAPVCTSELPLSKDYEGEPNPIPPLNLGSVLGFDVEFESDLSIDFTYNIEGKILYMDGSESAQESFSVSAVPIIAASLPVG